MSRKSILYIQFTNPAAYPPLEYSSQILADNGWKVTFVGTGGFGGGALQFPARKNIRVIKLPFFSKGWLIRINYVFFALISTLVLFLTRSSVIYASDAWSYPIGYVLSFVPTVRVVMHEHDTPDVKNARMAWIKYFRERLARRAIAVVVPQEVRGRNLFLDLGPQRLFVVHNCPRKATKGTATAMQKNETLTLWFHGSIVPTQLPLAVVDAMKECRFPIRLEFAGYETIGHVGYVQRILEYAKCQGLGENVLYHGAIPQRKELLEKAAKCHIGLALFEKSFREPMVGASNKPFDYLATGLVLLVPDTEEWNSFFVNRGCGISCDSEDAKSIQDAIVWIQSHPDALLKMQQSASTQLESVWNYDFQFLPVLKLLQGSLESR